MCPSVVEMLKTGVGVVMLNIVQASKSVLFMISTRPPAPKRRMSFSVRARGTVAAEARPVATRTDKRDGQCIFWGARV